MSYKVMCFLSNRYVQTKVLSRLHLQSGVHTSNPGSSSSLAFLLILFEIQLARIPNKIRYDRYKMVDNAADLGGCSKFCVNVNT